MDINKEIEYLKMVETVIDDTAFSIDSEIDRRTKGLQADRTFIWETFAEMDEYEQAATQNEAHIASDELKQIIKFRAVLERQKDSPYWGKIIFQEDGMPSIDIYIGIATLADSRENLLVVDWRAPVGNLYYDFELGEAQYRAPAGIVKGEIEGKVQFKIKNAELQYAVDTTTTITDEILIGELAKNASILMKNIAATIQKEQNKIIRYPINQNLLIQGVAGSGKTSIALHRVAYILYNCRGIIRAKDILIVSPNRAFSGYISHVLPELGEQNVVQISFENMANTELSDLCTFEKRTVYLEEVYNGRISDEEIADMKYKASERFVSEIKTMVKFVEKKSFVPKNFVYRDYTCTKETFQNLYYKTFASYPPLKRIPLIVGYVEDEIVSRFNLNKNDSLHAKLVERLNPLFRRYSPLDIYKLLLNNLAKEGKPVIVPDTDGEIPFEDVYGLLLLKVLYAGTKTNYGKFKHVVIDEMQDYIPTQYAIINSLFECPKDILGDMNQIIDPYMNIGSIDTVKRLLGNTSFFSLETSYRSSSEIIDFANTLTGQHINAIDRHDEVPELVQCTSIDDEARKILAEVDRAINVRKFGSVAIIAKNTHRAEDLYEKMKGTPVCLLTDSDTKYQGGIILTTALIVKGFEFDEVIVADADSDNYSTDSDRHILFVACTRALHVLKLFYTGDKYTC